MKKTVVGLAFLLAAACGSTQNMTTNGTAGAQRVRLEDDREVAMVLRVANLGEVREGNVARTRAASQDVKNFAAMMVTDHTAAEDKAEAELTKAEISFVDTDLSRNLDAESGRAAERLSALSGAAFDRAYMDRQIEVHRTVLQTIDASLMPQARNRRLRDVLTEMRKTVQTHLERAQQIRGTL